MQNIVARHFKESCKGLFKAYGLRFSAVSKMSGCITTKNLAAPLLGTRWQSNLKME